MRARVARNSSRLSLSLDERTSIMAVNAYGNASSMLGGFVLTFETLPDQARLIEQFSMNVPILYEEKKYALTKGTQVDVSCDP